MYFAAQALRRAELSLLTGAGHHVFVQRPADCIARLAAFFDAADPPTTVGTPADQPRAA